jgi:hypothetical protein
MKAEELIDKKENTAIEMCILWVLDDAYADGYGSDIINQAAKDNADNATTELAVLQARIVELERLIANVDIALGLDRDNPGDNDFYWRVCQSVSDIANKRRERDA